MNYLLIAAGSALGGMARHLVTLASESISRHFPWGTFVVNTSGCFLIGILAAMLPQSSAGARLFLMTGFLGGFTTFSAYSLQGLTLLQQGKTVAAAGYLMGSVLACMLAVAAGYWLGQQIGAKA